MKKVGLVFVFCFMFGLFSVSTIEAIAHTAHAAGLDDASFHNLLLLFRLQKLRVLDRVRQGNRIRGSSSCRLL